ncbi:hypothetical protein D5F01_LYC00076 [Larimichthys crocea]|uniref:Peroxisomal ATPase PEX6 double psi barrel domain-containing protein n=1 Tax=Larimichthys crocea TaxID=215358 RepID=A0A6G0J910_LARCR|nr:hypothetical protein D5F01_LYC00076 [Larimichthys crocea]
MEAQVELWRADRFPAHLSPLDVFVFRSQLDSVFRSDADPPTVLFTPQRPPHGPGRPGILLRVHPAPEEQTADWAGAESRSRVRIFTSRFFMRHTGCSGSAARALSGLCSRSTWTGWCWEPAAGRASAGPEPSRSPAGCWSSVARDSGCWPGKETRCLPRHPLQGEDPGQGAAAAVGAAGFGLQSCHAGPDHRRHGSGSYGLLGLGGHPGSRAALPAAHALRVGLRSLRRRPRVGRSLLTAGRCWARGCPASCRRWSAGWTYAWWTLGAGSGQRSAGRCRDLDSCVLVSKQLILRLGLFNHEWVKLSRPGGSAESGWCRCWWWNRHQSLDLQNQNRQNQNLQQNITCRTRTRLGLISATLWFNMTDGDEILRRPAH